MHIASIYLDAASSTQQAFPQSQGLGEREWVPGDDSRSIGTTNINLQPNRISVRRRGGRGSHAMDGLLQNEEREISICDARMPAEANNSTGAVATRAAFHPARHNAPLNVALSD